MRFMLCLCRLVVKSLSFFQTGLSVTFLRDLTNMASSRIQQDLQSPGGDEDPSQSDSVAELTTESSGGKAQKTVGLLPLGVKARETVLSPGVKARETEKTGLPDLLC